MAVAFVRGFWRMVRWGLGIGFVIGVGLTLWVMA